MNKKLNILICPLEWGLGHAARMIPLARKLQEMNHNVIIASGEAHLKLFREELPGLLYIHFPGFRPSYSRFLPQYLPLLMKTPLLLFHIGREHYRLKRIISDYSVDIVISDNRFGLWNKKIRTAYVTHMPLIPFPKPFRFLEFMGIFLHRLIIKKYSLCFIPDLPGEINLTGRLSHNIRLPGTVRYIGILSRFSPPADLNAVNASRSAYNTVILSGPEPQREIFKNKVLKLLKDDKNTTCILEGKPGNGIEKRKIGNFIFCSHLPTPEMQELIEGSGKIITRAGYSTIMELISLNRSALLVPTPGQPEQEYLADYLSARRWFSTCTQQKADEGAVITHDIAAFPHGIAEQSSLLLNEALKELLE